MQIFEAKFLFIFKQSCILYRLISWKISSQMEFPAGPHNYMYYASFDECWVSETRRQSIFIALLQLWQYLVFIYIRVRVTYQNNEICVTNKGLQAEYIIREREREREREEEE